MLIIICALYKLYPGRNTCHVTWPDNDVDVENVEHDDDEDVIDKKKHQFLAQMQKVTDCVMDCANYHLHFEIKPVPEFL